MAEATWPVIKGTYIVGDPAAPVAVCALTSEHLMAPLAQVPGVAIAGKVYTANQGLERILSNITANPAIRFLLVCGKDSPLFRQGQSLVALAERGMDAQQRIIGAVGYDPVLPTTPPATVARFRRQVEIIDWTGEEDVNALATHIGELVARNPGRLEATEELTTMTPTEPQFTIIQPGGKREPLQYDPKGYFVITLDRDEEQILLRHYLPDHTPAHEMRGRVAGTMLLGLLREGLVTQLSHAGYMGEELTKAQLALRLGLRYDQDRPLRPQEAAAPEATPGDMPPAPSSTMPDPAPRDAAAMMPPVAAPASAPAAMPSGMGRIPPALTWAQWQATAPGTAVDVVVAITALPQMGEGSGTFLEADEAEPFSTFRRTPEVIFFHWSPDAQIIMGGLADIQVGALVRMRGTPRADRSLDARQMVIITHVARIVAD
jgi:tetrahydromethanopterin S-methyltransferase subunit A